MAKKINFPIKDLKGKESNLISNGFELYLNTWEKHTVHGDTDLNHLIYVCKKGEWDNTVVDIYYNENDKRCWLEYSKQHKSN